MNYLTKLILIPYTIFRIVYCITITIPLLTILALAYAIGKQQYVKDSWQGALHIIWQDV
jgi:hypothetical protein